MLNKFFKMFVTLSVLGVVAFGVGCKDYDDDIKNLQDQYTSLKGTVDGLQALINNGSVITNVTNTNEGVEFTLSNGQKYTVTNGKDGQAGANGESYLWTIQDGYWYLNGQKTEHPATGVAGAAGEKGDKGADGKNGNYYRPEADGFFHEIDGTTGEDLGATSVAWKTVGGTMSVVKDGNKLVFSNGDGTETVVELGADLGGVEFIPDFIDSESTYPTTKDDFYYITAKYLKGYAGDESVYTASYQYGTETLKKSNEVEMYFRLNPSEAYLDYTDTALEFINRDVKVKTRAYTPDKKDLLNVASADFTTRKGQVTVKATMNAGALKEDQFDFVALQVYQGTQNFATSDYIHVYGIEADPILVHKEKSVEETSYETFYDFVTTTTKVDTNEYINKVAGEVLDVTNYPAHHKFAYNATLDLLPHVAMMDSKTLKFLENLGFKGIHYVFSLPAEYLANDAASDARKTNQQKFVTLDGSVISVSKELTSPIEAIGRTPVVRVDAHIFDNEGVDRWLASAYIKLKVVTPEEVVEPDPEKPDLLDREVELVYDETEFIYNNLTWGDDTGTEFPSHLTHLPSAGGKVADGANQVVAEMDWFTFNQKVYGPEELESSKFWDYYGGANNEYTVTVTAKNNPNNPIISETALATDTPQIFTAGAEGIQITVNMWSNEETTSHIHVAINKNIKTQHTWDNGDGKAEYLVEIRIKADDNKEHKHILMKHTFYVEHKCYVFDLNPLYDPQGTGKVHVRGDIDDTTDAWVLSTLLKEHFHSAQFEPAADNVFDYCTTAMGENIIGIEFAWDAPNAAPLKVALDPNDGTDPEVKAVLAERMKVRTAEKQMNYLLQLFNGETCDQNYDVVFYNPFIDATSDAVVIVDDAGEVTEESALVLKINDIYGYLIAEVEDVDANGPVFTYTDRAATPYHLDGSNKQKSVYMADEAPDVAFAFDENNADYKEFISLIKSNDKAVFEVNPTTGTVTWRNGGTWPLKDYHMTILATVYIGENFAVVCEIPLTFKHNPLPTR